MRELETIGKHLPSERPGGEMKYWKEWALAFQPGQRISATDQARILGAIRRVEHSLLPATTREIAIQIARLDDFATAFNVPSAEMATASAIYREALATLPPDLLEIAVSRVIATHRWGMRLPLPAEISSHVSEEAAERRKVLGRLQVALRANVEAPRGIPTADERAAVDAMMAKWRATRESVA